MWFEPPHQILAWRRDDEFVPTVGFEPTWIAPLGPKPSASTHFATSALIKFINVCPPANSPPAYAVYGGQLGGLACMRRLRRVPISPLRLNFNIF